MHDLNKRSLKTTGLEHGPRFHSRFAAKKSLIRFFFFCHAQLNSYDNVFGHAKPRSRSMIKRSCDETGFRSTGRSDEWRALSCALLNRRLKNDKIFSLKLCHSFTACFADSRWLSCFYDYYAYNHIGCLHFSLPFDQPMKIFVSTSLFGFRARFLAIIRYFCLLL